MTRGQLYASRHVAHEDYNPRPTCYEVMHLWQKGETWVLWPKCKLYYSVVVELIK